ncbi:MULTISPECIES: beta-ketoacyl-[acyl-carrier-protein] synthase family protein [Ralstonia]|jgi:3-oxoacyl-[acyl-carrier-protein] synthase-1|uniref:3-oxoacyl-(Acyl-carrier-protein) synthase n=1 Tax=Ralstonia pickettii OR214 TaxID=1264675 RepID=R0CKF6_RALPI|nr:MULTISPECIES: beta-ketoacyl-[acyl-carrier-protein] synthase family protein [Ralstonia]MEA3268391.1 beta-ketoacyl-[acyl-carrier-protein] synthase family protein [Pseudomonadota bacterium]ENZ77186.1 3-oxoacyl-(acyl-carrier-protein) synthase [Ralstonia pickettii OR214]MCM3579853.1 beta-ketoacyl-[acyl-carrier-protein] synthase family protein [Ralstonia pickettii]MDR9385077.1 beta-ketoacyl-[acyl-carrier-protein] synthase family protein [Ralstonia sp. 11b]OYU23518.1 MAG: beta-ketoacyl-[acyl-carri
MTASPVYLHALGMVNALGDDVSAIRRNLATGHAPGMRAADRPDGSTGMVGRALAALELEPPARLSAFDCRNNRLLLAALAQIQPVVDRARAEYGPHRIGIVLGTSTSGIDAAEAALLYAKEHGKLPDAFDYRQMEIGTLAPFAAAAIGTTGPAYTVSTACTSSAKAFASARRLLQLGLCDAVVVGGADSLCELTLQGFASLESTSAARTNPMSRNRAGINIGEGAAVFLMTREPGPVRLAGVGESSDAHHISAPDPTGAGAESALRGALADAGIDADAIGYVNLHATATRKNDEMEAHLMARVFPQGVPTSGTKPLTGHTLGAAGATELGFAWLTLTDEGIALPRHIWDGEADPALPTLDLIEDTRRLGAGRYVMSNSFAFGGSNASLILGEG